MEVFTTQEARLIKNVRRILRSKQDLDFARSFENQFDAGMVHQAAEVAEEALFDMLNIATHHAGCTNSGRWLLLPHD